MSGWRARAALIDLDGTLVDSAGELAAAVDRVRTGMGHAPAGEGRVRGWVGEGVERLLAQALTDAMGEAPGEESLREARRRFETAYAEVLGTMSALYPGVVEGLDRLRGAGIATACVTNKARIFAVSLLGALGIADRFDTVIAGGSGAGEKPSSRPLLAAAKRLGVAIGDCVVLGDSAIDVAAARAAGCPAWCVRTGYDRGEPVDAARPDAVFDRFDELAAALVARRAPG